MRITRSAARLISEITVDQNIPMAGYKLTGLGAGSASGHSLRYEQVIDVYLLLAGGTLTGDLNIGAHLLKTTNLAVKEGSATDLYIRNAANDAYKNLALLNIDMHGHIYSKADAKSLFSGLSDDNYFSFKARENSTGDLEIARMAGAAVPYWNQYFGRYRMDAILSVPTAYICKSADETVNDSNTMQNDDELVLAVGASDVWYIFMVLRITTGNTPDFKWQFTVPSGGAIKGARTSQLAGGIIAGTDMTSALSQVVDGVTSDAWVLVWAVYVGGGTAGNLQLQWAQNTADASDTKLLANSILLGNRVA